MTKNIKIGYKILDLDSTILGFKTAKIEEIKTDKVPIKTLVQNLVKSFIKEKIKYATLRLNAKDVTTINILEKEGFVIVDGYLILIRELGKKERNMVSLVKIREANVDDIKTLQDDIAPTFIYSRFFTDPLIKKSSAVRMHKIWIENCIKGKAAEKVYVAMVNGKPVGFIALEIEGKKGHIPLIGVSLQHRGKHISQQLTLYAIKKWFAEKDVKSVRIETQLTNIPAARTYENLGFRLTDSAVTLRWAQ